MYGRANKQTEERNQNRSSRLREKRDEEKKKGEAWVGKGLFMQWGMTETALLYQDSLPRPPMAELNESRDKHLNSISPVVHDNEYEYTQIECSTREKREKREKKMGTNERNGAVKRANFARTDGERRSGTCAFEGGGK